MIRITNNHDCCGCAACAQRCPKHCITMEEDREGFLYPRVDEAACVGCGLCERVCPLLNRAEPREPLRVLAAKNMDEPERLASSSGGVFIALAKLVLGQGGVVFGAVFDVDWQVYITHAETLEGVRPMMGSKYVQARMGTAYRDAERFLKAGRKVLFTGSPCQIAGLHRFLRKEYANLLAVDFLCHGVPSPGVWRRYLHEMTKQEATSWTAQGIKSTTSPLPRIQGIRFRDKALGWGRYSFSVAYLAEASGQRQEDTVSRSRIHYTEPYMRGFLSDVYLRPSCYGCASKGGRSGSDLTIADFWGVGTLMPGFDDDKGVGLVLLGTQAGEAAFAALPMEVRESTMAHVVLLPNGGFNERLRPHPKRAEFYARFQRGNETIEQIVTSILHQPRYKRALHKGISKIKQLVGRRVVCALKRLLNR